MRPKVVRGLKQLPFQAARIACGSLGFALVLSVLLTGCGSGEEAAVEQLDVTDVVAYWSVVGKRGDNVYIHPVVRFRVRNDGEKEVDYVQTLAVFRLESNPDEAWGNAYEYSLAGDPVLPGDTSRVITLKSDSRFFSKDDPKEMLENKEWEQVFVELFVRVGSSTWKSVTKFEVPRRVGAPGVEKFLQPQEAVEPSGEEK